MADSYVQKKSNIMKRLLWTNIVQVFIDVELAAIPGIGPFLALPPVKKLLHYIMDRYFSEPLFLALSRWGVFTSIDWKQEEIYAGYSLEADKLIKVNGGSGEWTKTDKLRFRASVARLLHFHISA